MYEVKNRYAILFSAALFLDKIVASVLKTYLYLRSTKKNWGGGDVLYKANPSGELTWIPIWGKHLSPN